ncbi:MAG: hypothetical protein ACHQ9S_18725 [Candidatus Binatia bacterium]
MTSIIVKRAEIDRLRMAEASSFFDMTLTPHILRQIRGKSKDELVAWWSGFAASLVGAMSATVGERKTIEICDDLYDRAKDWESEQMKEGLGVCSAIRPTT